MRSQWVNMSMYEQMCKDTFGPGVEPFDWRVNAMYGGADLEAFNIILTNGNEDPWKCRVF